MRSTAVLLTAASSWLNSFANAKACNADNCARAATGTLRGLQSSRLAACSSFQRCTVTAPDATQTITLTANQYTVPYRVITSTRTVTRTEFVVASSTAAAPATDIDRRRAAHRARSATGSATTGITNCPTAIPSEASACSGVSRYQSACSCAGINKSYITIGGGTATTTTFVYPPVGTVTATYGDETVTTVYITSTLTAIPTVVHDRVKIRYYNSDSRYNQYYMAVHGTRAERILAMVPNKTDADKFYRDYDHSNRFRSDGDDNVAVIRPNNSNTELIFYPEDQANLLLSQKAYDPVKCFANSSHPFTSYTTCQASNGRINLVVCEPNKGGTAALDIPYVRLVDAVPNGCLGGLFNDEYY